MTRRPDFLRGASRPLLVKLFPYREQTESRKERQCMLHALYVRVDKTAAAALTSGKEKGFPFLTGGDRKELPFVKE